MTPVRPAGGNPPRFHGEADGGGRVYPEFEAFARRVEFARS